MLILYQGDSNSGVSGMIKPFSQACENNKTPILDVLGDVFSTVRSVLEVGSGTGQHAVYFAQHLPHLIWQPTDLEENLKGIMLWAEEHQALSNLKMPRLLDITQVPWPVAPVDGIFSANTLHIMGESEVERFFEGVSYTLIAGGTLCIYGPFNYGCKFTSDSNARFNDWLYQQNPKSAIRDFEWINSLAGNAGLALINDHPMPANNRLLEWRRAA